MIKSKKWLYGQQGQYFENLNDWQFEIHIHMHTDDLFALSCSSDHAMANTWTLYWMQDMN